MASPSLSSAGCMTDQQSIDLLHGLVGIQSLSGQEAQAAQWLTEQMSECGLESHVDAAGNAVGVKGSGPANIVLLGHIDTVPGDIPVRIENAVLHGRGAVDAKGPLATFVAAAAAASGLNATITVVGAVGEEAIGSVGANHVKSMPAPDYCIIGEPSGWDQVCLGYRGTISFEYVLRQDSRHSAGPGESVAERAVSFWTELTGRLAGINGDSSGFHAIGPSLRGFNTTGDGLQDEARLSVGLRLPPSIPSTMILPIIHELAGDAEIEIFGVQEGYQTDKRSSLTPPFLRAIRAEGGTPRFTRKLGTSDMSVVGPAWQCPIVAYGPGDSSLDHTPEERIDLNEYLAAIRILTKVLDAL